MRMSIQNQFASHLKAVRLKQGLSVTQLAEKAGVSRQYIRELESPQNEKRVTIVTLQKIAKALKIPISNLLSFDSK